MITRFMQVMFSAAENNDEELTSQVANDIETAKASEEGSGVEDDEVSYVNLGSGKVLITDKGTGEATVAEQNEEDPEQYDLEGFENDEDLEKYLHTIDGVTPDENVQTEVTENFEDHMTGEDVISPNLEDGGLNPEAGHERSVTEVTPEDEEFEDDDEEECEDDDEEEKVYSVTMTEEELNMFSEYCESLYSEEEEDECDEDNCGEQYEPLFVVGIDPVNHVIVDSPVYSEEDANILAQRFAEDGVEAVEIFDCPDAARDHATSLLGEVGVTEIEQVAEPQEHQFSDVTIYTTRYFTDCTEFMFKLFSETDENITDTQDNIEDAIESGEQKETESEVITPIDDETAVVHDKDNDEYTKVTLTDDEINTEKLTEEEADDLLDNDKEEEEKEFSLADRFFAEVEAEQQASFAPVQAVDASQINPETGDPVNVEPTAAPAQSVEVVEDKALAAVQSIQEAANEAVLAIAEAKDAPAPGEEQDLKEAQFSDTKTTTNDTLSNWFENNI